MPDESINSYDAKAEEQRYIVSMLPTQLLIKGTPEGKGLYLKVLRVLTTKNDVVYYLITHLTTM